MTPQPKDQPVDELSPELFNFLWDAKDAHGDTKADGENWYNKAKQLLQAECNRALAAQRQALRDEVLGAIGEDEPHVKIGTNPASLPNVRRKTRNTLRANIRTAISTIFEGKE